MLNLLSERTLEFVAKSLQMEPLAALTEDVLSFRCCISAEDKMLTQLQSA